LIFYLLISLKKGYAKTVHIGEKAGGPSTGAVPSVFAENQKLNSTIFMTGRPFDKVGPVEYIM